MTDYDELRRLAAGAKRATTAGRTIQDMADAIHFQETCITAIPELLDALEAAPAWRKHPTCPGLWVFDADQSKRWSRNAYVLSDGDIENFDIYGFPKTRCYGPIPNPPEETTT